MEIGSNLVPLQKKSPELYIEFRAHSLLLELPYLHP
jgi:hypothetical protein